MQTTMTLPPITDVSEKQAASRCLYALGDHLAADLRGDYSAALAALDQVMAYVYRDPPDAARARLVWLTEALTRLCRDALAADHATCGQHYYAIRGEVNGQPWEALPPHRQIALAAVVIALNGDDSDATALLHRYAETAGTTAMARVLSALADLHNAARTHRPPGRHRRPDQ